MNGDRGPRVPLLRSHDPDQAPALRLVEGQPEFCAGGHPHGSKGYLVDELLDGLPVKMRCLICGARFASPAND